MTKQEDQSLTKEALTSIARAPLPSIMLLALTVFLGLVLYQIATGDTSIPVASNDLEAAARANERMLQIVQWSLASILGLGLALIGINWFSTTRDKAEVRAIERKLESTIAQYEELTSTVNDRLLELDRTLWPLERKAIWEDILDLYQDAGERSVPRTCVQVFRDAGDDHKRKRAAIELLLDSPMRHTTKDNWPNTADSHDTIVQLLPEIQQFDLQLAIDAYFILCRDLELLSQVPESERPEYTTTLPPPPR